MRIFKRGFSLDQFNVVAPELIFQDFCLPLDYGRNFPKKLLGGGSMLQARVLMSFEMVGRMGERQNCFAKRFARDGSGIDTIASHHPSALDYRSPFSKLGRLNGGPYASGAAANA